MTAAKAPVTTPPAPSSPTAPARRTTGVSGATGFDFTKIANDGSDLAAGVALGANPGDWACTRDNATGLTWEVKTTGGLRNQDNTYTWYNTDAAANGGNVGDPGNDTCGGTLSAAPYNNQCNTANFIAAVNAASLCGASDWRLPSPRELLTVVHKGVTSPAIDTTYFPNTAITVCWWDCGPYWTSASYAADSSSAWNVSFDSGNVDADFKSLADYVRLVRGGQF